MFFCRCLNVFFFKKGEEGERSVYHARLSCSFFFFFFFLLPLKSSEGSFFLV